MPELPNNQDAERARLGLVSNRDAVIRANAIVKPADFTPSGTRSSGRP